MSPVHAEAKTTVLNDLIDQLGGMGLEKLKGAKKVSVSADSKEGLEEGLSKAKELLGKSDESEDTEEECDEDCEDPSHKHEKTEDLMSLAGESEESPEDIDSLKARIAELEAKLKG